MSQSLFFRLTHTYGLSRSEAQEIINRTSAFVQQLLSHRSARASITNSLRRRLCNQVVNEVSDVGVQHSTGWEPRFLL